MVNMEFSQLWDSWDSNSVLYIYIFAYHLLCDILLSVIFCSYEVGQKDADTFVCYLHV